MNILADFHHADLYYSLQLLFEKRLGHSLFRPIGIDWYSKGFWMVYDSPDTAEQYLGLSQGHKPPDGTLPLNDLDEVIDECYICKDEHNNTINKAVTLETFKKMDIDIVIASIPAHLPRFKRLITEHKPNAKLIFQQGNMFSEILNNLHEVPNLLSSTAVFSVPGSCNATFYHQEFDTTIFTPASFQPNHIISSFINVYDHNTGFTDYMTLKAMMPEFDLYSYGAQNMDGVVNTTTEMAALMHESMFGFHVKGMGDGFGHILYNWFACGRPVITRISDYKGKLGEELLEHDVTCFDLDRCSLEEVRDKIINIPPHQYTWMCQQVRQRFDDRVNYDKEELQVREFLKHLN